MHTCRCRDPLCDNATSVYEARETAYVGIHIVCMGGNWSNAAVLCEHIRRTLLTKSILYGLSYCPIAPGLANSGVCVTYASCLALYSFDVSAWLEVLCGVRLEKVARVHVPELQSSLVPLPRF